MMAAMSDPVAQSLAEVDKLLAELRALLAAGTAELVAYKAEAKRLETRAQELAAAALGWRQKAEKAVLAGDDELAKQALTEERRASEEHAQVLRERREADGKAARMLKQRREMTARLAILEAKKGTLAAGLAQTRGGGSSVVAAEGDAWDAFARVEDKIEDAAVLAELDGELEGPGSADADLERRLQEARADKLLADLKVKMGKPTSGGST
jgi:phage shock protein A